MAKNYPAVEEEFEYYPAEADYEEPEYEVPARVETAEIPDMLKKAVEMGGGVILGSIGANMLAPGRSRILVGLGEAFIGALGAIYAANNYYEDLFWVSAGVSADGMVRAITGTLEKTGLSKALEKATGTETGGTVEHFGIGAPGLRR